MSEEDTKILREMWGYLRDISQRLEHMSERLERVEAKVDQLDHKLDKVNADLTARIDRSDLFADKHADKVANDFVHHQQRVDARFDKVDRRFERIEARLDAIDGRLLTLNATVALHDLKLREAT